MGGYTAAIRAAQLGAEVTLFERDLIGGTCLNRGCIPTKALVRSAGLFKDILRADEFGISLSQPQADLAAMIRRNQEIVTKLRNGVEQLLKANKVGLVRGDARVVSPTGISVLTEHGHLNYSVDRIIVATGSEPAELADYPTDGEFIIDTNHALALSGLPASIAILGAGIIAVEFAAIFQTLGCQTIVIARSKVLRTEEPRMVRQIVRNLTKAGVRILEGASIDNFRKTESGLRLSMSGGEDLEVEKLLIAVGRAINAEGLGLEEIGVERSGPYLAVDDHMQTSVPGVFAVGDVAGEPLLAHAAGAEGKVAAANVVGGDLKIDRRAIPNCIFTIPEAASVGLTDEEAKAEGIAVKIGRFPYTALGKALADGEPEGFVQIVADESSGAVLGAHIVGAHASDIIHEIAIAITKGMKAEELGRLAHQHPSFSEAIMEATEAVDGLAIHAI